MRVMIFCDLENFRYSIRELFPETTYVDVNFNNFHEFLFKKIVKSLNCGVHNPRLIRDYIYTGQYTDAQRDKAKKHLESIPKEQDKIKKDIGILEKSLSCAKSEEEKQKFQKLIRRKKLMIHSAERLESLKLEVENSKTKQVAQSELFRKIGAINFVELKEKPLKYSHKDLRFIQKGTDVQLAVDLVNFAHLNNYDLAIVCSGDLDLLESCKLVKSLGKTIILVSHGAQVSPMMIKHSDFYFDLGTLALGELEEISSQPISHNIPSPLPHK